MRNYFSYIMYIVTASLLLISVIKNKNKTKIALMKAIKMLLSMLPLFIAILLVMGLLLAIIEPETIKEIIGNDSGILGTIGAAIIGAIAVIPVLIAFPVASELLKNGAGIIQITAFLTSLTTVGIITIPLEQRYFGKKIAIMRNLLFFLSSFIVAIIMKILWNL